MSLYERYDLDTYTFTRYSEDGTITEQRDMTADEIAEYAPVAVPTLEERLTDTFGALVGIEGFHLSDTDAIKDALVTMRDTFLG